MIWDLFAYAPRFRMSFPNGMPVIGINIVHCDSHDSAEYAKFHIKS